VNPAFDVADAFLAQSRRLLSDSYLPRIVEATGGLSDEQLWWRANAESNSIGNLVLHLAGNVRQWIVCGVGGAPDERERQQEFDERGPLLRSDLLARLQTVVREADGVLADLQPAMLGEERRIQGYQLTIFHAIYAVVEHFSTHTGQILLLSKRWKGDLGLYDVSQGSPRPTRPGGKAGD
jgi:hypothetical protein